MKLAQVGGGANELRVVAAALAPDHDGYAAVVRASSVEAPCAGCRSAYRGTCIRASTTGGSRCLVIEVRRILRQRGSLAKDTLATIRGSGNGPIDLRQVRDGACSLQIVRVCVVVVRN